MSEKTPKIARTVLPPLHQIALPTPFPVGDINVYLAEGEPLTLIDCGVRNAESRRALEEGLHTLGYDLHEIKRLMITHHHTDHLGLAEDIVKVSGAEVWSHPYTVRWLERPHETRNVLDGYMAEFCRSNGVPEPSILMLTRVSGFLGKLVGAVGVTTTIDEGETIRLAGYLWQVYHTPGHAGDMICFYQPERRVLLCSDHLLRDISSNPLIEAPLSPGGERPRRLLDYIQQMERMAALDIDVAYPGHGDPILDVGKLVNARLEMHYKRAEKLYALFEGQPRTIYELGKLMFPKAADTELFLVISEVQGHLDMLNGRVSSEVHDGVVYWCP